jgi:hypothetical protein
MFTQSVFAQINWDYGHTDSVTYDFYIKESWAKLITVSDLALKQNTDFYYLRVRRGIAFYQLENYRNAKVEFEQALHFFPVDTFSKKMIYYSMLYSGDALRAEQFVSKWPVKQLNSISLLKKNKLKEIGVFGGVAVFDLASKLDQYKRPSDSSLIDINGNKSLLVSGFYVNQSIKKGIELTHSFGYYQVEGYHYLNDARAVAKYINPGKQISYSLSGSVAIKSNWILLPSLQINHTNSNDAIRMQVTRTRYLPPQGPGKPGKTIVERVPLDTTRIINTNFIQVGFGAQKRVANFEYLAKAFYGFNDTSTIVQLSGGLDWYPYGNRNLYFQNKVAITHYFRESFLLAQIKAGKKINKHCWLEAEYVLGNLQNYTHPTLNSTYSTNDQTGQSLQINAIAFIRSHFKATLSYSIIQRRAIYLTSSKNSPPIKNAYLYLSNQFLISTSWTF